MGNLINIYKKMTFMERLGFFGSVASIVSLLFFFFPQERSNKDEKSPQIEKKTQIKQEINGNNSPIIINYDGQIVINNPVAPTSMKLTWKAYNNYRYGFSVEYPKEWEEGAEAENSDGLSLFSGDPDIDIRVYASIRSPYFYFSCSEEAKEKSTVQMVELKTGSAEALHLFKDNGKMNYCMQIVDSDIDYIFYAQITNEFFEKNKLPLIKLIKSFRFIDGIERRPNKWVINRR